MQTFLGVKTANFSQELYISPDLEENGITYYNWLITILSHTYFIVGTLVLQG